jgi:hypothetical protein
MSVASIIGGVYSVSLIGLLYVFCAESWKTRYRRGTMRSSHYCHELGRELTNTELCLFYEGYTDGEKRRENASALISICEDGEMRHGAEAYAIGYSRANYDVRS